MGKIKTTKKEIKIKMGKIKTTKKEIMKNFNNIISIGYCDLQYLLCYKEPVFYTCGVYGWYSDIYILNSNLCISTGYRPFGNKKVGYDILQNLNYKSEKIVNNNELTIEQKNKKLDDLLNILIKLANDENNKK